jgi:hypothetical protein
MQAKREEITGMTPKTHIGLSDETMEAMAEISRKKTDP